jgi:hypothetical protein
MAASGTTGGVMLRCQVFPDDGSPFEVAAYSRDVRAWEQQGRGRRFADFQQDRLTMTSVYGLTFIAAKRQGLWQGTLQEFEEGCDVMPMDEEDEAGEADPTSEGPSTGLS